MRMRVREEQTQTRTLLLVEDSRAYKALFTKAFSGTEFNLIVCDSGEEALKIIENNYIDFICSSFYLHDMEGTELCRKMRSITLSAYKPFVLITSVSSEKTLRETLPAGVTDIFHKNDLEQFVAAIRRYPFINGKIQGRILYVEDSLSQREAVSSVLTHHGLTVDSYPSAEQALAAFLEYDYDVVITDVVLEGTVSGLVFVNQIRRQIGSKGDVPILAVTAFDDATRRLELFHLGVNEYIIKPILDEELFIRINSLITRKKLMDVDREKRLADMVYQQTHEAVMVTDENNQIIAVNPAFTTITGYSQQEVFGRNPNFLSSGKQTTDFYDEMWQALITKGHWHGEVSNRRKNGEIFVENLSISTVYDQEENPVTYIGFFTDTTSYKEQEKTIELLAHYDVLTGLPNRILFGDRFEQAIGHANRQDNLFALCILDIDDFKLVNNVISRRVGDSVLIEVSERIKATLRIEDTVSRHGGDQFVLLIRDLSVESDVVLIIDKILNVVSVPISYDEGEVSLTASVGITLYPDDEVELNAMLRHADQALYEAKVSGKKDWKIFNVLNDQQTVLRQNNLHEISQAIESNQLCLYYQPKVNMRTGEITGFEALIRWQHPQRGLLPPIEFLPIIEQTELEVTLGQWVIEKALEQMTDWQSEGVQVSVSINISGYHLQSPTFFDHLKNSLSEHASVDPRLLQLEILESGALGELNVINQITRECCDTFGITIALDDFGTGYSSLSYLRNLPATIIKVDRGFVRDMLDDPNDYAIIDGVIGLADSFNLEVIAEGVESVEHGEMLLLMGCDHAQGYVIAKPMPEKDVLHWQANYQPPSAWSNAIDKVYDVKNKKSLLFKLVVTQWMVRLIRNINSEPEQQTLWPILDTNHCHCGSWIRRAKFEQIYNDNWLDKFEEQHIKLHSIANEMFEHYQAGKLKQARSHVELLQTSLTDLIKYLNV